MTNCVEISFKAFEGSRDDPVYQSPPLSKLDSTPSGMRAVLPSTLLLLLSSLLLFSASAKPPDKRVLPGSLVRQIDKTNAENLWRLLLTASVQQPPEERREEKKLRKLIKELTKERLVVPADDMRR